MGGKRICSEERCCWRGRYGGCEGSSRRSQTLEEHKVVESEIILPGPVVPSVSFLIQMRDVSKAATAIDCLS